MQINMRISAPSAHTHISRHPRDSRHHNAPISTLRRNRDVGGPRLHSRTRAGTASPRYVAYRTTTRRLCVLLSCGARDLTRCSAACAPPHRRGRTHPVVAPRKWRAYKYTTATATASPLQSTSAPEVGCAGLRSRGGQSTAAERGNIVSPDVVEACCQSGGASRDTSGQFREVRFRTGMLLLPVISPFCKRCLAQPGHTPYGTQKSAAKLIAVFALDNSI
jgi:hypothetical protein